jgi:serine/threonine protein phosphatase PrpC
MTRTLPAVEFAQKSDPGRDPDKQTNEDACAIRETRFGLLAVVCDGMGGHSGGAEASALALQTVFEQIDLASDGTPPGEALREAIRIANRNVFHMQIGERGARPGSTIVTVLLHKDGAEIGHVGDSRVYLVHEGQIFQVTKDHSMVQELVDRGFLTPAQAAVHPSANQITRALGMGEDADVEIRPSPIAFVVGDAFVLCSDGLSDLVEPHEILKIVGAVPPQQAAGQLVDLANARGGHDNISVQVLRPRESAMVTTSTLAPTLAQTAHDPQPNQGDRTTQPGIPAAEALAGFGAPPAPPPLPSAPQPPASAPLSGPPSVPSGRPTRSRSGAGLLVGALLVVLGLAAAGVALYVVLGERRGKHHQHRWADDDAAPLLTPTPTGLEPGAGTDAGTAD